MSDNRVLILGMLKFLWEGLFFFFFFVKLYYNIIFEFFFSKIILGGAGFIGRHLVKYLIDKNLASFIRVVDKRQPQTVYLGNEFSTYFSNKIVECKQANLSAPKSVEAAFHSDQGKFNWVINLAAETRFGKEEKEYQQMVHDLSLLCAAEGEKSGCSVYIEVSTAQVYSSGKV